MITTTPTMITILNIYLYYYTNIIIIIIITTTTSYGGENLKNSWQMRCQVVAVSLLDFCVVWGVKSGEGRSDGVAVVVVMI